MAAEEHGTTASTQTGPGAICDAGLTKQSFYLSRHGIYHCYFLGNYYLLFSIHFLRYNSLLPGRCSRPAKCSGRRPTSSG